MSNITITGKCRWAKVQKPDAKYNYYGIELLPDADGMRAILNAGITTLKPSKDGEGYFSFKRRPDQPIWKNGEQVPAGAPVVLDKDGNETKQEIGNGSTVTITCTVFPYNNKFGKGVSCRLDTVKIVDLVEFVRPQDDGKPQLKIMF